MTDIVIIGGGIAGISAAARLAPIASVTLLEAERNLAYHASGRSAAAFVENYGNDVVVALNRASLPVLASVEGVLTRRGGLLVGRAGEEERFRANVADWGMERIGAEEAMALVPILDPAICTHFAADPEVADIDTDLLLQSFRREALEAGARIETGQPVTAIGRRGGTWLLDLPAGQVSADVIVNAAGAWADEIAAMAGVAPVGLQPYRRSMARLPAPGGHDVSEWPFIDAVDDAWYAKPDAGALLVSPAEEDPVPPQDAWADDMVLAEGLARYDEMVTEPVTRLLANWAGLRSFAPDRALVIGRDPAEPRFFWLAGQGGYGFQTCAAAAELARDLLDGRVPGIGVKIARRLAPDRFGG